MKIESFNKNHVLQTKKLGVKETVTLTAMCAMPALLVFVFNYLPMFGLQIAFKNFRYDKGIFESEWCGLDNFTFLFESNTLFRIVRNTVGLNILFIALETIAAVTVAIMLFEITSRKKIKVYQTLMLLPYFISWVIVSYIVYALLNPSSGVVNSLLKTFGLKTVDWYSRPEYWPFILSVSRVWKGVGMGCIVYYASLMGLDSAYFEAATVDGANKWQVIKNITIPSLIPLIVIQTILSVGNIMRADFGLFYQVPRNSGALYPVTDVIDTFVYRTLKENQNVSLSTATSFLQSFVSCVLVLLTNYIVTKVNPDNALF